MSRCTLTGAIPCTQHPALSPALSALPAHAHDTYYMILSPDSLTSLHQPCSVVQALPHTCAAACLPACPAAGNCIAKWNHRWFASFLLLAQIGSALLLGGAVWRLKREGFPR